jgi:dTDP-4-dehydrorhamnose 3,5-epimerase
VRFVPTPLAGLVVVEIEPREDDRGMFARTFCADEFAAHGLHASWPQCNVSWNAKRATIRGMHFQKAPHEEPKLVRCTRGRIFDVAIDLRPRSPTFKRWFGVELSAEKRSALHIPGGFAHGFQALVDDVEVFYQMGERYRPELASGVRWNDPAFAIAWPLPDPILSSKDAGYPDFVE